MFFFLECDKHRNQQSHHRQDQDEEQDNGDGATTPFQCCDAMFEIMCHGIVAIFDGITGVRAGGSIGGVKSGIIRKHDAGDVGW